MGLIAIYILGSLMFGCLVLGIVAGLLKEPKVARVGLAVAGLLFLVIVLISLVA